VIAGNLFGLPEVSRFDGQKLNIIPLFGQAKKMLIELYYQPGCPHLNRVRKLLDQSIQSLGLEIIPVEIPIPDSPEALKGPASPTVLIDHLDLEPESAHQSVSGERIYLNGTGVPDGEKMRFQIARAAGQKTVLFICTGNAVRSQMAEALVNHFLKAAGRPFPPDSSPRASIPWWCRS
jgi:hypothetical protein